MAEENTNGISAEEGYEPDILTLQDESGKEHSFEVVDAADFKGERYLALVPYDEDPAKRLEQDTEMLIMRVAELDGEEVLDLVEDDEELLEVGGEFLRRLEEIYDIDISELQ